MKTKNLMKIKTNHNISAALLFALCLSLASCTESLQSLSALNAVDDGKQSALDKRYIALTQNFDYLGFVRETPQLANSFILYNASRLAMQKKNIEDAFLYFEMANTKAAQDLETCLPTPKAVQESLNTLSQQAATELNLFAAKFNANNVLQRFQNWPLLPAANYHSGWQCQYKVLPEDKRKVANRIKQKKLDVLVPVVQLLSDGEYVFAVNNALRYLALPVEQQSIILSNQYKRYKALVIAKEAQAGVGLMASKLP